MAQYKAYWCAECCGCAEHIIEGDPIYFCDEGKLCETCADDSDLVCPVCGGQKQDQYDTCYDCKE